MNSGETPLQTDALDPRMKRRDEVLPTPSPPDQTRTMEVRRGF